MLNDSPDLSQVLAEATDIAQSVGQSLTSAHLLLALFTVPNPAEALLKERGVDEDRLLAEMTGAPVEEPAVAEAVLIKARELATGMGAQPDCLHLLVALTRVSRSGGALGAELLASCGLEVNALRTQALGYVTGVTPRRLLAREAAPVHARAAPFLRVDAAGLARELRPKPSPAPRLPGLTLPSEENHAPTAGALGRYELDPADFPWLTSIGRNLCALAEKGQLDKLIGREHEIEEVLDIIGKRRTNNPVLVGEPGVGKTALVEGLAQRIVALPRVATNDAAASPKDGSTFPLCERIIVEIDMASVLAGTSLRGAFSEKLGGIKEEVRRADGRVVVFIDELHTLIGAGATGDGPQDAANELKAALARGEFPCIGATTHDEFRKHIQSDPALERRFTAVVVRPPTPEQTVGILTGAAPRYEAHHGVRYGADALEAAAHLTARHVHDRALPDKAVSAMDLAGSRVRREGRQLVTRDDVARVVAKLAGLPEERLLAPEAARLRELERVLSTRIVGHRRALERIATIVRRNYAGFSSRRPLASLLLCGPAGVGKTELARALSDAVFGEGALVRIDLSDLTEQHGVARLLGAPPGYVGYGEPGQLTEPLRRRPASLVLFDEAEKAHPSVLQVLLQILEEGAIADARDRQVSFSSAIVVLATNAGGESFSRAAPIGFADARNESSDQRVLDEARGHFSPELWSRLDEKLVLAPLVESEMRAVAALLLGHSADRLAADRRIRYRATPDLIELLLTSVGVDRAQGARPLRAAVQRLVEGPLAERILAGDFSPGDEIVASANGDVVAFSRA